jgi:hypothetical protein
MKTSTLKKASAIARAAAAVAEHLGPGEVIEVGEGELLVELEGGALIPVTPAFSFPYEPAVGDVLLVISRGGQAWSIGVIHGTGRASLRFQGDVEIAAEGGALRLSGERGVDLHGPEIAMQADRIRMIAGSLVQTLTSVYQRVSALLSVQAREAHTAVEETSILHARRAAIVTDETVTINGKQVHLG